jgi:hypothetical protein
MMLVAPSIGQRVRLVRDVDLFPATIVRAGVLGTVVEIDTYIAVRLDQRNVHLDEWDNCLQCFDASEDEYPCTVADFELVDPRFCT